ncbi:MAG: SusC/RagA family TonB-linked outer membrane protein, partial [Bacteroidota bacterium]
IDQALQGRAAGVQIASTSGMPGSGTSIRIRGHGSLGTSNAPLWVIDGYVGADINTVAPEDIQSIEILKDASSTAIYGARGGNGVIIVTTRHGDANQNRLNFAHYTEMRSVIKTMDMLNAPDFMKLRNEALANDGFDPQYSEGEINLSEPIRSTGYIADTDWQDELFRNALAHYYHLGMSGGSEKTRYAISANYKTEDGIIHYSEYEKAGINLNLIHEISDKVNFGTNIKGYLSEQQGFEVATGSSWAYGPAGNAVVSLPIYPVNDSLGGYYTNNIWDNPLYAAKEDVDIRNNAAVQGNFYVNYSPIKYLNLNANISGEFRTSMRKRFVTAGLNEATLTQNLAKGLIAQGNYTKWIGNLVATYDREFNNVHHVVAMIGVEQQVIRSNSHIMNGTDINKETLLWYDFNAFNPDYHQPYSDWWSSVYQSQFSRLTYNLKNRYLLQATVRRDGSSKFGSSKKFGIFPSFSLAWKIHHEEFISNLGVFDQLKVRLSWGQSGNDQIALYQWLPEISYTYPHNLAVFGDNVVHSAIINKIPNNNIGWEASTTINAGLDLSFLKNRLNITVDLYDRTTTDLLWDDLLPLYTGYGDGWSTNSVKITTNLAEMNNKGIELAIGVIAVNSNDWNVEVNMNISTNKNNVVYMGGQNEFYVGTTKVEVGQPIGNIWGYKTNGLYSVQDSIAGVIPTGSRPGDQKYVDTNGDSIINDDDRTVIGNALPDFTAGLNASISYKGWQVSMTFNSFFGNDMYNGTYETIAKGDLGRTNGGTFLMNAWNVGNQESDIPRLSTNYQSKTSDRFVEDASFLKMTNFMISYNLPGSFLSKIKVQDMKLYVSGQNLLVLSKYSGFDPEQHSGGDSNLNLGSDNKNYPSFRAFTAGISLTF